MKDLALFQAWIESQLAQRQSDTRPQFFPKYKRPLPGLLTLSGPAGCGKTTLLQEWMASLLPPGAQAIPPAQRVYHQDDANMPTLLAHTFVPRRGETPFQTASRLEQELGGMPFGQSASERWETVASTLKRAQLNLLIIDQADAFLCPCAPLSWTSSWSEQPARCCWPAEILLLPYFSTTSLSKRKYSISEP